MLLPEHATFIAQPVGMSALLHSCASSLVFGQAARHCELTCFWPLMCAQQTLPFGQSLVFAHLSEVWFCAHGAFEHVNVGP